VKKNTKLIALAAVLVGGVAYVVHKRSTAEAAKPKGTSVNVFIPDQRELSGIHDGGDDLDALGDAPGYDGYGGGGL
jgi:hypothetical protein